MHWLTKYTNQKCHCVLFPGHSTYAWLATASRLYCDNIYTGCIVDSSQSDSIYGCYKWTHFLCQHGKNIGKKYNLFPQGSILVLSQFISWINLNFGIEVCFVPGLTGYIKAWLQFVFPGYIFLILLLIVIFARYSKRLLIHRLYQFLPHCFCYLTLNSSAVSYRLSMLHTCHVLVSHSLSGL